VLVEALAAGASVVALDTPQTREVLAGSGAVVADDPAAIAAALRAAFVSSRADRYGGSDVAAGYDAARAADRTLALYRALIGLPIAPPLTPERARV
jgi:glycosyltransferase involved in cell wall biosynthesis